MEAEADIKNHLLDPRRINLWSRTRGKGPKCKVWMLTFAKSCWHWTGSSGEKRLITVNLVC